MFASRNSTRMLLVVSVALALSPVAWASGVIVENASTPFGKFNGLDYLKHVGRLEGATTGGNYRVPYEIIAPADPTKGNGTVLVEPSHFAFSLAARDILLGHEFLFGRGFSHAGIGWSLFLMSILDPGATDVFIDAGVVGTEIIADFVTALKEGPAAGLIVGNVQRSYSIGYSQTTGPLHEILHSPLGLDLLDLTFLVAPSFAPTLPHVPATGSGRIMVFATEADIILFGAAGLRAADYSFPYYRMYEVAGAPHVPDTEGTRTYFPGPFPPPIEGTTPLDWTLPLRAILVAGNRWTTKGTEPPPSASLEEEFPGVDDPVYGFPTGIARDENLNAKGGVRMPDSELGRGQFIAVDFAYFFYFGGFIDLRCELLPDGSERFPTHGLYSADFARVTQQLVSDKLLLPKDAADITTKAGKSEVGKPGTCP